MKAIPIAILPIMLFLTPACIIVDHEHPGCIGEFCDENYGEIAFWWSFEMRDGSVTDSCYDAEISEMDVIIYDELGDLEFEALGRPCGDTGAIIDNFYPGTYELQLTAVCRTGMITHESYWDIEVYEGRNDFGVLILPYLGDCL
jgi:hypothetical protein